MIRHDYWWVEDKDGKELANGGAIESLDDGTRGSIDPIGTDVLQALAAVFAITVTSNGS